MPWHVVTDLPDGRTAVADRRDPVARHMQVILRWVMDGRPPARYPADAYAAVTAWLDGHEEQSRVCEDSLPGPLATALGCGHG